MLVTALTKKETMDVRLLLASDTTVLVCIAVINNYKSSNCILLAVEGFGSSRNQFHEKTRCENTKQEAAKCHPQRDDGAKRKTVGDVPTVRARAAP